MQPGTLFRVEGTSVVGMSLGPKGKGEIDSFNLIDIVKGVCVKRCDGKCILATKRFTKIAKHFFELGMQVSNKAQKGE